MVSTDFYFSDMRKSSLSPVHLQDVDELKGFQLEAIGSINQEQHLRTQSYRGISGLGPAYGRLIGGTFWGPGLYHSGVILGSLCFGKLPCKTLRNKKQEKEAKTSTRSAIFAKSSIADISCQLLGSIFISGKSKWNHQHDTMFPFSFSFTEETLEIMVSYYTTTHPSPCLKALVHMAGLWAFDDGQPAVSSADQGDLSNHGIRMRNRYTCIYRHERLHTDKCVHVIAYACIHACYMHA